jgi:hypothetical protein
LDVDSPLGGIEAENFHGTGVAQTADCADERAEIQASASQKFIANAKKSKAEKFESARGAGVTPFHVVNLLVASVVAGAGISLAVLVSQAAAESLENGSRSVVFRGNKSDSVFLTCFFCFDDFVGFGVSSGKIWGRPGSESTNGRARRRQQSANRSSEHYRSQ